VFRVCELFFKEKKKVADIAEVISRESGVEMSRESVYPLLAKAVDLDVVRLIPPLDKELARKIAERYQLDARDVWVVGHESGGAADDVPAWAAGRVLQHIKDLGAGGRNPVRLALGPGRAALDFSRHLGKLLRAEPDVPKIRLYAAAACCPPRNPQYAPVSFFNLYPRDVVDEFVGLFAESVVTCDDYRGILDKPGVREAFRDKHEVDIVVTAMGDLTHECDLFRWFLEQAGVDIRKLLRAGVVGNVQYRPYGKDGPVLQQGKDLRVVTLFEIEDFVQLAAQKNKHVVLLARSCSLCGGPRVNALRPLLEVRNLRVWSELVIDLNVARWLASGQPPTLKRRP
jgi:DNA-binding transcriptional regulator LsrR (DeoR family)